MDILKVVGTLSFMELIVAKNIEAGKEIIPGVYVVKDRLITINPDGPA